MTGKLSWKLRIVINLASMGLQVFTTCGSDRKKQYLLDTFPQLREDHIGHSRDCSFEDLIMHKVRLNWLTYTLSCSQPLLPIPRSICKALVMQRVWLTKLQLSLWGWMCLLV